MAIHIEDINKCIELLRDTQKVFIKLNTTIPVSDISRLSIRIDKFLDRINEN